MYNTNGENFNYYHLDELSNKEIIKYAKLLIKDASKKEKLMKKHDTLNNSYNFASASRNVSYIIEHINERKLKNINFKFGVENLQMYDTHNIEDLLKYLK